MAVLTSRMAAAIDALYNAASNDDAMRGVAVVDGPLSAAAEEIADSTKRLFIGTTDPRGEGETISADGDQAFRTIGGRWRDETFQVRCMAEGWNGDGNLKQARDDAVAVVAAVETMLRPTPANPGAYNLGGAVMWAGIGSESITVEYDDDGAYARVDFAVACRANLTQ